MKIVTSHFIIPPPSNQPTKALSDLSFGLAEVTSSTEEATVDDLKAAIIQRLDLSSSVNTSNLRLVLSNGKTLRHPSRPLSVEGILDSSTIHVYYELTATTGNIAPARSAASSSPLDAVGGDMLPSLMENPATERMLQEMLLASPDIQAMIKKQPELKHTFSDPNFLKDMMKMATNPRFMQDMQRKSELAMSQLENIPGGFAALTSMYRSLTEDEATVIDRAKIAEQKAANERIARELGVESVPEDRVNDLALPNPWSPRSAQAAFPPNPFSLNSSMASTMNPFFDLNQMFQRPNSSSFPIFQPQSALNPTMLQPASNAAQSSFAGTADLKVRYRDQLDEMKEMGFEDEEANLRALLAAGGNVESAINFLFTTEQQ